MGEVMIGGLMHRSFVSVHEGRTSRESTNSSDTRDDPPTVTVGAATSLVWKIAELYIMCLVSRNVWNSSLERS